MDDGHSTAGVSHVFHPFLIVVSSPPCPCFTETWCEPTRELLQIEHVDPLLAFPLIDMEITHPVNWGDVLYSCGDGIDETYLLW